MIDLRANLVRLPIYRPAIGVVMVDIGDFNVLVGIVTRFCMETKFFEGAVESQSWPFNTIVFFVVGEEVREDVLRVCRLAPAPGGDSICFVLASPTSTSRCALTEVIPRALCSWNDWTEELGGVEVVELHCFDQILAFALEVVPLRVIEKGVWEVIVGFVVPSSACGRLHPTNSERSKHRERVVDEGAYGADCSGKYKPEVMHVECNN
jgi:hypothetical protein